MVKKVFKIITLLILIVILLVLVINIYVVDKYKDRIINIDNIDNIDNNIEAVVVMGASAYDNKVSIMLKDRLDRAIDVVNNTNINVILNTGSKTEVEIMSKYLEEHDIDIINIKEDNNGSSTYRSMNNLVNLGYKKVLIVSQKYHLYRCLYNANELGLDAYAISSREINYSGQLKRDIREVLARVKDFILNLM